LCKIIKNKISCTKRTPVMGVLLLFAGVEYYEMWFNSKN
jgi:hypothetical protein